MDIFLELNFKEIKIEDKDLITGLIGQNSSGSLEDISCEKQFATIFSWRFAHPVQFAECGEGVVFGYKWQDRCLFMIKQPDMQAFDNCIRTLMDNCDKDYITVINLTESKSKFLSDKYGVECTFDINYSDYIYDADSFRTYSGKKLHNKKNKLNKFLALYGDNYEIKPITNAVIDDCFYLLDEWKNDNGELEKYKRREIVAAEQLLVHYGQLQLYGCCLYVGGKPIGFTIGEPLFENTENSTLVVHCEKASYDYEGVYPALAHFFALQYPQFKYINREDDVGDDGLRQSKRSFSPLLQLHKYSTILNRNKIF